MRKQTLLLVLLAAACVKADTLSITAADLPQAVAGTPYAPPLLQASGGTSPYSWSLSTPAPPAGLTLSATGQILWTPSASGAFSFGVKVTDSTTPTAQTATKVVSITVNPPLLVITTATLPAATAGAPYTQTLGASGGTVPYAWSLLPTPTPPVGLTLNPFGQIDWTPSAAATVSIGVRVIDAGNPLQTTTQTFSIKVNPPPLLITTSSLTAGAAGTAYSQTLHAAGGVSPYLWTLVGGSLQNGLTLSQGGIISGTPAAAGTASFRVRVTDSASVTADQDLTLTVTPPTLSVVTASLPDGAVGTAYSQTLAATGGTSPYTWSVQTGTAPGLVLSSSGTLGGTPTASGTFTLVVQAADANAATATKSLTLKINPPALAITSTSLANGTLGMAYSQSLAAAGGVPPVSWTVTTGTLPAGLTLSLTGQISGTPTELGTFSFTVQATDSATPQAQSKTQALSITIGAVPLAITTTTLPNGTVTSAYSQTLAATGGTPPYKWTVSAGSLPAGLTLSVGGQIAGTPTEVGTFSFTVQATDSATPQAQSKTQALSITIGAVPLAITTTTLPNGMVTSAYSQTLTATGGTPPYKWTVSAGSLPAGLTLSVGGQIAGTPAAAGGPTSFTVQVADSASTPQTKTQAFSISIDAPALVIGTATLANGTVGTAYTQSLAASGGVPPYSWAIPAGTLQAGLTLSAAGQIAGTPVAAGTASITVRVTDSANVTANRDLTLTVAAPGLSVTTTSLPDGAMGAAYAQALAATGGTPPYTWTLASGTLAAGLTLSSGGTITGTPSASGTFSFVAQVTDSAAVKATQGLSLTVGPAALAITSTSLANGMVGVAYSEQLAATGGVQPYTWTVVTGSLASGLTLSTSGLIAGTPVAAATAGFTVRATDSAGKTASQALSLKINTAALLILTDSAVPTGAPGVAYVQALSVTGGTPPYAWSITAGAPPPGLQLSTTGLITGTPSTPGTFSFTAQVTDAASALATKPFTIMITQSPTITTYSPLPQAIVSNPYSQALTAVGGTPPYLWYLTAGSLPSGLTLIASAGNIGGTPAAAGTSAFTVQVVDSRGASATRDLAITVVSSVAISTSSLPNGTVGTAYSQTISATGGTAPYTFSLSAGSLPPGLTLSANGGISGSPTTAGTFNFTVQTTDRDGAPATKALAITVVSSVAISTSSLPNGTVGTAYSQTISAAGGTAPYTFSLSAGSLPPGLTLSANGGISGSPTTAGTFNFTVQTTDRDGAPATKALAITVVSSVAISTSSLPNGTVGTAYSQTISAAGGTAPYTFSLSAGSLPPGLTLSANGGISGSPTTAGTFNFTAQTTDRDGAPATKALAITVVSSVAISTSSLPNGTVGTAYSQTISATGGAVPYTFSLSAGSLPPGLTLSANGVISGSPTTAGTFNFTVQTLDRDGATATKALTVTVAAGAPALTISSTLSDGTVDTPYTQTLQATGGSSPYTWSVGAGGLPAWMSLSSTGVLSGTPTAAGTFVVSVQVTDSAGVSATRTLTIKIAPAPPPLTAPPSITTSNLPDGSAGSSYTQYLAASGGKAPYTWSLTSGSLAPGLSLNASTGAITGTPAAQGSFTFTAQVTDSVQLTASKSFTMVVVLPPLPAVTIGGLPDPLGPTQQPAISVTLAASYPLPLTGQLTLAFAADAAVQSDDPTVQFASGGRSLKFTIPARATQVVVGAIQTGTVAGTITLAASLQSGSADVTPSPAPGVSARLLPAVPVIRSVQLTRTSTGFNVTVVGFSTPREVTQAVFHFSGSFLQTADVTLPLGDASAAWYQSSQSAPFGSQFSFVQPFTVQGDSATISSVSVTLTNSLGVSQAVSASF